MTRHHIKDSTPNSKDAWVLAIPQTSAHPREPSLTSAYELSIEPTRFESGRADPSADPPRGSKYALVGVGSAIGPLPA